MNDDLEKENEHKEAGAATPELLYPDAPTWFEDYLSYLYRRDLGRSTTLWCERWFDHPEALTRIQILWRSWEAARQDDTMTGLAVWFVNVADPMMRELFSPEGTFKRCIDRHEVRTPDKDHLPYQPYYEELRQDFHMNTPIS